MAAGNKKTTVNKFRDDLVLAIIVKHGLYKRSDQYCSPDFRISHGSTAIVGRKVCVLGRKKASRNCPSCPFMPTLCQCKCTQRVGGSLTWPARFLPFRWMSILWRRSNAKPWKPSWKGTMSLSRYLQGMESLSSLESFLRHMIFSVGIGRASQSLLSSAPWLRRLNHPLLCTQNASRWRH